MCGAQRQVDALHIDVEAGLGDVDIRTLLQVHRHIQHGIHALHGAAQRVEVGDAAGLVL